MYTCSTATTFLVETEPRHAYLHDWGIWITNEWTGAPIVSSPDQTALKRGGREVITP
jgi:hypothetical protein